MTSAELAVYDGIRYKKVYIAVLGTIFDVTTSKRLYGQNGSYHGAAGKDASRAFLTGTSRAPQVHEAHSHLQPLTEHSLHGCSFEFKQMLVLCYESSILPRLPHSATDFASHTFSHIEIDSAVTRCATPVEAQSIRPRGQCCSDAQNSSQCEDGIWMRTQAIFKSMPRTTSLT